jgi:hypothetical protein
VYPIFWGTTCYSAIDERRVDVCRVRFGCGLVSASLSGRVVGDGIGVLGWDNGRVLDEVDSLIAMINPETHR